MDPYDRWLRRPPFSQDAYFRGARGAYDRGVYGGDYPGPAEEGWDAPRFGRPRDDGGPYRGYDRGMRRSSRSHGYDRGYDGGYATEPFLPEEAYLRHPEYDRPPGHRHAGFGWEAPMRDPPADEAALHRAVCRRLGGHPLLDPRRVEIRVRHGIVRLAGEVDDFRAARDAWEDAWRIPGVRGVLNHLTVRADRPMGRHGDVFAQSPAETPDARRESMGW